MRRPFVVGICGGIGSGKSTAARVFARLGARVIDADRTRPRGPCRAGGPGSRSGTGSASRSCGRAKWTVEPSSRRCSGERPAMTRRARPSRRSCTPASWRASTLALRAARSEPAPPAVARDRRSAAHRGPAPEHLRRRSSSSMRPKLCGSRGPRPSGTGTPEHHRLREKAQSERRDEARRRDHRPREPRNRARSRTRLRGALRRLGERADEPHARRTAARDASRRRRRPPVGPLRIDEGRDSAPRAAPPPRSRRPAQARERAPRRARTRSRRYANSRSS